MEEKVIIKSTPASIPGLLIGCFCAPAILFALLMRYCNSLAESYNFMRGGNYTNAFDWVISCAVFEDGTHVWNSIPPPHSLKQVTFRVVGSNSAL